MELREGILDTLKGNMGEVSRMRGVENREIRGCLVSCTVREGKLCWDTENQASYQKHPPGAQMGIFRGLWADRTPLPTPPLDAVLGPERASCKWTLLPALRKHCDFSRNFPSFFLSFFLLGFSRLCKMFLQVCHIFHNYKPLPPLGDVGTGSPVLP